MKPTVLAGPLATLLIALLVGGPAFATQSPGAQPPKWWNDPQYKRELGLTQEQSKRLEDIFQAAVPAQRALKKTLDEAEALFERLANEGDKKAAGEQINRVVAARAELMKSHSVMLLDMRFVLTPDQWTRLGALQQALEKQRAAEKGK
jgi:Spy/CpxP family protein refolding chaperone